jgi:hypothetical protein
MLYHAPPAAPGVPAQHGFGREKHRKLLIGEVAERSKALDWNSSNISTGVRGFESHPLRQARAACELACGSPARVTSLAGEVARVISLAAEMAAGHFSQWNMVARIGFSATTSREPRQGRKAAAAAAMSGAGAQAGAGRLQSRAEGLRP